MLRPTGYQSIYPLAGMKMEDQPVGPSRRIGRRTPGMNFQCAQLRECDQTVQIVDADQRGGG